MGVELAFIGLEFPPYDLVACSGVAFYLYPLYVDQVVFLDVEGYVYRPFFLVYVCNDRSY